MSAPAGNIDVLHVDDEPEVADLAAEFIETQDKRFDIDTATSANEAIDRLPNNGYDCIVSDFDMPGQDGIEFLEPVLANFHELPFVLYTGNGSEEVASEAIAAGVTDYLQKGTGTSHYEVLGNRLRNTVTQRTERVFDPGYSTGDAGNGLGLNIVQEIAEAHGWDVRVAESTTGGARFEITGVSFAGD